MRKRRSRTDDGNSEDAAAEPMASVASGTTAAEASATGIGLRRRSSTSGGSDVAMVPSVDESGASPPTKRLRRASSSTAPSDNSMDEVTSAASNGSDARSVPKIVLRRNSFHAANDSDSSDSVITNAGAREPNPVSVDKPGSNKDDEGVFRVPTSPFIANRQQQQQQQQRPRRAGQGGKHFVPRTGFALLEHANARSWGVRPSTSGTATPDIPDFDYHDGAANSNAHDEIFFVNDCTDFFEPTPSAPVDHWDSHTTAAVAATATSDPLTSTEATELAAGQPPSLSSSLQQLHEQHQQHQSQEHEHQKQLDGVPADGKQLDDGPIVNALVADTRSLAQQQHQQRQVHPPHAHFTANDATQHHLQLQLQQQQFQNYLQQQQQQQQLFDTFPTFKSASVAYGPALSTAVAPSPAKFAFIEHGMQGGGML